MIRILDYGINNLRSIEKAVQQLGFEVSVGTDIAGADKVIIPGVGAFSAAMRRLEPLRPDLRAFAKAGNPLMGICLGQQLLFDSSEEHGAHGGLGLVPGSVQYLPTDRGEKVPHMGWAPITYLRHDGIGQDGSDGEQVYFVHSLHCVPEDPADIAGTAVCGIPFAAMIQRENIWGTQFHPEKSSVVGLRILKRFLEC